MNYRHAFHAGNFADVHKHVVLLAILDYLKAKPSPFFALDTHAGRGFYDLSGDDASRGGEWQQGIQRLLSRSTTLIEITRYLDIVKQFRVASAHRYPGSPVLMGESLRPTDRATLCELNQLEAEALTRATRRYDRVTVSSSDGYAALKAQLPPKENRGVVLIDPPYEASDEFSTLHDALLLAHKRWRTGIYCVWYPIKADTAGKAGGGSQRFLQRMQQSGIRKQLLLELCVRPPDSPLGLNGSGLLVINPPYQLDERMQQVLPALQAVLAQDGGETKIEWWASE